MFQLWLDRQPTASWAQLIAALKQLQLNYLASQIESKLTVPVLEHSTNAGLLLCLCLFVCAWCVCMCIYMFTSY